MNFHTLIKDLLLSWSLGERLSWSLASLILIILILLIGFFIDQLSKRFLVETMKKVVVRTKVKWDDYLLEAKLFEHLAHLIPATFIYLMAAIPFPDQVKTIQFVKSLTIAYMILMTMKGVNALFRVLGDNLHRDFVFAKNKPIKSYLQVASIILHIIAAILVLSTLLHKSPWGFLSGLGAMTAIILLVFKDTILGFVASIQLSAQDMVRRGDWIDMPDFGADGDVIDITINTVKVKNFDNTVTTIPTYALISKSFKNWRAMSESQGRRIKRAIYIDMRSIVFLTKEQRQKFKKFQIIHDYLTAKEQDVQSYNQEKNIDDSELVNGRRLTNVGTFRAYIKTYLQQHPMINQNLTLLVRQLAPGENGLPIEIYVFSSDKNWINYEEIQADIFDHILAVIPEFDLRVFQNPTGDDFKLLVRS